MEEAPPPPPHTTPACVFRGADFLFIVGSVRRRAHPFFLENRYCGSTQLPHPHFPHLPVGGFATLRKPVRVKV